MCTQSEIADAKLPNPTVVSDGTLITEYLESYFTTSFVNQFTDATTGKLQYNISIEVKNASRLNVDFAYNPLSNAFDLELYEHRTTRVNRIGKGALSLQAEKSGGTHLGKTLTGQLSVGKYTLVISQPALNLPFMLELGKSHCYPFFWDLSIVPNRYPAVFPVSISPEGGNNLSPLQNLEIDIRFSEPLYVQGKKIGIDNANDLRGTFALSAGGRAATVVPTKVSSSDMEGLVFHLTWSPSVLESDKTYYLVLVSGSSTTNELGQPLALLSNHRYDMIDLGCSGKGQYDNGYCFCEPGYAGEECDTCDIGYVQVTTNSTKGTFTCKKKASECDCSCDPKIRDKCVPLGTCSKTSSGYVCQCNVGYAGDHCEKCDNGFSNWIQGCPKDKTCPICTRGSCNPLTGQCVCPANYGGSTCDECAKGWKGDKCSVKETQEEQVDSSAKGLLVTIRVFSILIGLFVVIMTIAFFIYRKLRPTKHIFMRMEEELRDEPDHKEVIMDTDFEKKNPMKSMSTEKVDKPEQKPESSSSTVSKTEEPKLLLE